jgi:hypothetical protein
MIMLFSLFVSVTVILTVYSFIKVCIFCANGQKSILQHPNKQYEETGSTVDFVCRRLRSLTTERTGNVFHGLKFHENYDADK